MHPPSSATSRWDVTEYNWMHKQGDSGRLVVLRVGEIYFKSVFCPTFPFLLDVSFPTLILPESRSSLFVHPCLIGRARIPKGIKPHHSSVGSITSTSSLARVSVVGVVQGGSDALRLRLHMSVWMRCYNYCWIPLTV